jgi:hypothetical protein
MARSDKELNEHIAKRIRKYRGNIHELEKAIGCVFVGREMGWKVMLLVHDRKSVSKYEELLDLDFRKELPDIGKYADRSLAWRLVQKVSSFWKAVKGEIPNVKTPEFGEKA